MRIKTFLLWYRLIRCLLAAHLGVLFAARLAATSVVPPSFEELVGQSEYVVRAVVQSVTAEWHQNGGNRHIITKVEFAIQEVIAGTPPSPMVLSQLGGKVGDDELIVDGAPVFKTGEEHIIFVRPGVKKLFPLVAMKHGQYPVVREPKTGAAYMTRSNGELLRGTQDVAQPLTRSEVRALQSGERPLTPEVFANLIRSTVQATKRQSLK